MVLDLIKGGFDIVTGLINNKKEKQAKQQELDIKRMEAQATLDIANQRATTDYDIAALEMSKTSWKDEYLTLLLSAPFIGSFLPTVQDYVATGWTYVAKAPVWYQASFIGVIAASFGLRWLFNRKQNNDA